MSAGEDPVTRKLKHFSAQYTRPKFLPYGRSTELVFIIEGNKPGSGGDLIKTFLGLSEKIDIVGTSQMSATLTGPKHDVEITSRNAELQTISSLSFTKWIWDIEPKQTGTVILTLDVYMFLPKKIGWTSVTPTRRIEIPVTITLMDQTKAYLNQIDPLFATVSAVAGGVGAFLTFFGWRKKKDKDNAPHVNAGLECHAGLRSGVRVPRRRHLDTCPSLGTGGHSI